MNQEGANVTGITTLSTQELQQLWFYLAAPNATASVERNDYHIKKLVKVRSNV